MEIQCPHCKEKVPVEAAAVIPDSQSLYLKLTGDSDMFPAETIGKAIVNMEKLQRGVATNIGGKVAVFLKSMDVKPGEVTIGFTIVNAR